MITDALAHYGVVAGQGNIRGTEGPRNAVATGLVSQTTEHSCLRTSRAACALSLPT